MVTECEWSVTETGVAEGMHYSIHLCMACSREAVAVDGRINLSQWQCFGDPTQPGESDGNNSR